MTSGTANHEPNEAHIRDVAIEILTTRTPEQIAGMLEEIIADQPVPQ